jgi:hypothetical protein
LEEDGRGGGKKRRKEEENAEGTGGEIPSSLINQISVPSVSRLITDS